jgi:hypothetical protein
VTLLSTVIDGEVGSLDLNAKPLSQPRVSQIVMWKKAGSPDSRQKGARAFDMSPFEF